MKTGYLRKSIQKVADGYEFSMPSMMDMPRAGTGKPSPEQGRGVDLKKITDSVLQKYAEDIEQQALNQCP